MNFATDSAELPADAQATVSALAQILNAYPKARVELQGYADSTGAASHNVQLGAERAATVEEAMIAQGVTADRVKTATGGQALGVVKTDHGLHDRASAGLDQDVAARHPDKSLWNNAKSAPPSKHRHLYEEAVRRRGFPLTVNVDDVQADKVHEVLDLGEQKSAKIIALLEELRRDLPMIRSRRDEEAEALSKPADPQAVLDAMIKDPQEEIAAYDAIEAERACLPTTIPRPLHRFSPKPDHPGATVDIADLKTTTTSGGYSRSWRTSTAATPNVSRPCGRG